MTSRIRLEEIFLVRGDLASKARLEACKHTLEAKHFVNLRKLKAIKFRMIRALSRRINAGDEIFSDIL
jgi:hypothetical protein